MSFDPHDTIAAIATPPGEAGLAVIRISGARSFAVADAIFKPAGKNSQSASLAASHTLQYGRVFRGDRMIDEVLLAVMRAPRTFTREDCVEITCHGGLLPAKAVLSALLDNGARLAQPGEFTRRAFLNGRIDLAQAEAVADVIHSRTDLALSAAQEQLAGKLSRRINELRDRMMKILAHIEAHIDFPDEDIAPDTREALLKQWNEAGEFIARLLQTADNGRVLRRGLRAAIIGRPNVGKSSLLNQLVGRDRAIVSPTAGTTRDTIEETANIRGLPVVLIDTAGLRDTSDEIEGEGIRRSRAAMAGAELVLHVVDASQPLHHDDEELLDCPGGKRRLLVRNKADLPIKFQTPPDIAAHDVCCLTGRGIPELEEAVKKTVWSGTVGAEAWETMINVRHENALQRAAEALRRGADALASGAGLELAAADLRAAVNAVGEVVGKTSTEDLLDSIFSQFCIGK